MKINRNGASFYARELTFMTLCERFIENSHFWDFIFIIIPIVSKRTQMDQIEAKPSNFEDLPAEVQVKITLEKEIQKCDILMGQAGANGPHAQRTRQKWINQRKKELKRRLKLLAANLLYYRRAANGTFVTGVKQADVGLTDPVVAYLQPRPEETTTTENNTNVDSIAQ